MTVVSLKQRAPDANDVVKGLRNIADSIETGEIDFPISTAVVILGHTQILPSDEDVIATRAYWDTFALGPRCDEFTVRGLITTSAQEFSSR